MAARYLHTLPLLVPLLLAAACSPASDSERAASSAAPAAQQGRLPEGTYRVQRVSIMDPAGFEQPLPASFGFVPVGWRVQGGVQWGQQFACTNGYNISWSAQSPDGSHTVAILPQDRWETNNFAAGTTTPGCRRAAFTSVKEYLQHYIGTSFAAARVLEFRPREDLTLKFQQLNSVTPTAMGEMRTWVEGGEALFAFAHEGRDMQGVIQAVGVFSRSRTSGMGVMQDMQSLTGSVLPMFAASAPNGQLDLAFADAIRQSFISNPEWDVRLAHHNQAISRVALQEAQKRAKVIAEANDYVSRLRQETYESKNRSDDRRQREFGETIRGTETYDDPDAAGGQVELSHLYDHAWRLNDGTYVLSNQPDFDPWRELGVEGRRLAPTP